MGVHRPTEMTIRDLLQEELRKRGVTVVPEFSVSTPVGRLAPDMLLKNGAHYVVEAKLGAETMLWDAVLSCSIIHVRLNKPKRKILEMCETIY
jgi:hypothetical protein